MIRKQTTLSVALLACVAIIAYATHLALIAPTDALQGNVFRILYYHVPSSMISMALPYVNLVASVLYLYWRTRDQRKARSADAVAVASAEVMLVYATICLLTGMLWGRVAWGIWWTWDWRLTSMLILWLLYVSYMVVRRLASVGQTPTLGAVISVFAAIDVPIVYMSIRWFRTQHPAPIFGGDAESGMDRSMYPAFLWNVAAWSLWAVLMMCIRYRVERERQAADDRLAAELIEAT